MKRGKYMRIFSSKITLTVLLAVLVFLTAATAAVIGRNNRKQNGDPSQSSEIADSTESANRETGGASAWRPNNPTEADRETPTKAPTAPTQNSGQFGERPQESETAHEANAGQVSGVILHFSEDHTMAWPVNGEVIMEFSMDETVWYATLEQYRVCPHMLIQAEPGSVVSCPAAGQVVEIGEDARIGSYIVLSLGDGYRVTLGQLQNISVAEGQYVTTGNVLAAVAQPTDFFSVEGPHLYMKVTKDDEARDPLDYIR